MDQDFHLDVDEVRRSIDAAEVIALYFPYFRKTLLLDTRSTRVDPPMARVVDMVRSAEERLETLRRLRPRFARPKAIILVPWPRFVSSVKQSGVWQIVVERLVSAGDPDAEVALERCYRELLREERAELRRAVTGDGYQTMWERTRKSEV
ncbi:MAG: hypothetical protein HYX51_06210 [Chloroflexi bacterium]|nr:hypothetical protein [Chloroflexota bacterium]